MTVDFEYYRDIFGGTVSEEIISPLLSSGADTVSACICSDITRCQLTAAKNAACIQAEYEASHGNDEFSSVKLGDFSLSAGTSGKSRLLCPRAVCVLENAALLFRGGVRV